MSVKKAIAELETCDEYSLRHLLGELDTVLDALKVRTAILEELRSARPLFLLLYGELWISAIDEALADD